MWWVIDDATVWLGPRAQPLTKLSPECLLITEGAEINKKAVIGAVAAITAIAPTPLLAASWEEAHASPSTVVTQPPDSFQAAAGLRGPARAARTAPSIRPRPPMRRRR